jgi:hypothetical protein
MESTVSGHTLTHFTGIWFEQGGGGVFSEVGGQSSVVWVKLGLGPKCGQTKS